MNFKQINNQKVFKLSMDSNKVYFVNYDMVQSEHDDAFQCRTL